MDIRPIDQRLPDFVGQVSGIDLRKPLAAPDVAAIKAGMDRYAVLVFRGQQLTNQEQIDFTLHFGTIEPAYGVPGDNAQAGRMPPEINDVSNLDREGRVAPREDRHRLFQLGNLLWHSDSSYKSIPAKYSILSAHAIPSWGGDTEFADLRAAWDTLDAATQALVRDLVCEHSRLHSRGELGFTFTAEEQARFAANSQRLVRRHPQTGRLSLYLSSHGGAIRGWPLPEARCLLKELTEHATQRERVYTHKWQLHDMVMWDNRVTMHRGRRYPADQPRDIRRTTTMDDGPTLEQPA